MEKKLNELSEYFSSLKNNVTEATYKSYYYVLSRFVNYFRIIHIDDLKSLTPKDIESYMEFLIKDANNIEKAKNSANAHFRIIKAFCNWLLLERKYIQNSPCFGVKRYKEAKTLKVYLTKEERDSIILSEKDIKHKAILSLLLYTGIRVGEIVKIKRQDITENHLLIHGKGRKERQVIINSYVLDLINKYLNSRNDDCEFLFVSKKGFGNTAGRVHGLTTQAIRDIVNNAKFKANIDIKKCKKITPHTLRRTFSIRLVQDQKASAFQIQKVLGHSSILTTQRYLEPAGAEIADDVMLEQEEPAL
jgi:site-specific recombinase XerD